MRLRFLTAGESHGPMLAVIVEGLPAGMPVALSEIEHDLGRRRLGYGRGPRMKVEMDEVEIVGGVRGGVTLGSPVAIVIGNSERGKWGHVMPVEGGRGGRRLTTPRPGHADLPGMLKYGFDDARDVLERASARETAARTAAATLAKILLRAVGIEILSHVLSIGGVAADPTHPPPGPDDRAIVDASPVRCFDAEASRRMVEEIDRAAADGDSLGGVVEVLGYGIPPGVGSHVHWDRKLDGRLAGAVMSVPAIKGVEIGDGFAIATRRGSEAHDEIRLDLSRATNRSGGTEGGMSTGTPLRVKAAMKPLSTLKKRLRTVDLGEGVEADAFQERTDVCAVPAAAVVCESAVSLVLADSLLEMFGGDRLDDVVDAVGRYRSRIAARAPGGR